MTSEKTSQDDRRNFFGDGVGAFADGGILFPLLVLLSHNGSFSAPILFASAGAAYLVSGFYFHLPLAVQPLKAIAIAAVAVGASGAEIRLSGFTLGVFCLLISFFSVDKAAKKVPASVVHCVQLGLGVLLVMQGLTALAHAAHGTMALTVGLLVVVFTFLTYPILGALAVGGLIMGFMFPTLLTAAHTSGATGSAGLRFMIILSLILPQMALTLTNSVVATVDVTHRYFGDRAKRVTERHLLYSIGFGNIFSALIGGLPYCHGSGGITAHYRGGSRTQRSNYVIGFFLLAVAVYGYFSKSPVLIGYPISVLACLLIAVGLFHVALAKPTWFQSVRSQRVVGRVQILASALAAVLTHNMLVVLAVAAVIAVIASLRERQFLRQGAESAAAFKRSGDLEPFDGFGSAVDLEPLARARDVSSGTAAEAK